MEQAKLQITYAIILYHRTLQNITVQYCGIKKCQYRYHQIKTHDSELRGQEEAGRMRQTSELFTGSTALKLLNALNKPPLKLSLNQGLNTF